MPALMDVASSMLRSALTVAPGMKMVASDLANIEGRFAAWVAGETWKVKAFQAFDEGRGHDLYLVGAARVLGKNVKDVTPGERQGQGKIPELACSYGGAVGAFNAMAKIYGLELTEARALEIVKGWRKANPAIVNLWYELERQAKRAVSRPGVRMEAADGKILMQRDGSWLRVRLPSGRYLCYPGVDTDEAGALTYMGVNQYSRRWERLSTYGGKLFENICQAGSRDVLAHNMAQAEAEGYSIVLTVHDELVCEVSDEEVFTAGRLSAIMSTVPAWATGLPLAAAGWEGQRYKK